MTTLSRKYKDYLDSKEWAVIRCDIFTVRGERCEVCCSKKSLQIHHLSYANFGGQEEPEDLIILCAKCHMIEHGLLKQTKKGRKSRGKAKTKKDRIKKLTKYIKRANHKTARSFIKLQEAKAQLEKLTIDK